MCGSSVDRCCRVLLLHLAAAPAAAAVVVLGGYLYVAAQTGGISSFGLFGEVVLVIIMGSFRGQ